MKRFYMRGGSMYVNSSSKANSEIFKKNQYHQLLAHFVLWQFVLRQIIKSVRLTASFLDDFHTK